MILTVAERVSLLGILPEQGDFVTLKIVRKLREELSFSEEEIKILNLVSQDGQVRWEGEKDPNKDVQIGEKATDVIVEVLKKLNNDKKLIQQQYSLYEKFVDGVE